MRSLVSIVTFLTLLLLVPTVMSNRKIGHHRHPVRPRNRDGETVKPGLYWEVGSTKPRPKQADTLQIAGSSLPDCSHACGSCSPCKLVMVSFMCSSLAEAETCPMAYKCMCNSKSYPVP
ncbi:protein EPIDERMAL PATTERNING FACTOR 1-like [Telopea speciosissima]|uniref:protein EPIDERMAL PATTERNING FACTOR 1-like n=1 Tax=Telopea speciosissima TaxID=54955 RepID=UPI001CC77C9E|nr:protein EPIDERMAL PATTERNING FACTOR 1-like [Telopea speciosissima]